MSIFNKKEKNQDGNAWIVKMALQEAIRELEEEKRTNKNLRSNIELLNNEIVEKNNLEKNLEVLQVTIEKITDLCKNAKGNVVSRNAILKELGE